MKDIKKFNADKILRGTRTLFEPEEDYYEPLRIGNAFNSNYIEHESNGDKDRKLTINEYLDKIRPYLNNMIKDLKIQGEWKIQFGNEFYVF